MRRGKASGRWRSSSRCISSGPTGYCRECWAEDAATDAGAGHAAAALCGRSASFDEPIAVFNLADTHRDQCLPDRARSEKLRRHQSRKRPSGNRPNPVRRATGKPGTNHGLPRRTGRGSRKGFGARAADAEAWTILFFWRRARSGVRTDRRDVRCCSRGRSRAALSCPQSASRIDGKSAPMSRSGPNPADDEPARCDRVGRPDLGGDLQTRAMRRDPRRFRGASKAALAPAPAASSRLSQALADEFDRSPGPTSPTGVQS